VLRAEEGTIVFKWRRLVCVSRTPLGQQKPRRPEIRRRASQLCPGISLVGVGWRGDISSPHNPTVLYSEGAGVALRPGEIEIAAAF
jgi:hypothetical protein